MNDSPSEENGVEVPLLEEALKFLKLEQDADVAAMVEWEQINHGRIHFDEESQAVKTLRARMALIAKIEAQLGEPWQECPNCHVQWLGENKGHRCEAG